VKFNEFALDDRLLEAISYMGFETATPIQIQAIPEIISGKDLIACAQTGTGKSAAFILPVLNKIIASGESGVSTLVLVPTRELAIQINQQIQGFAYFVPVNSLAIYGGGDGSSWDQEKKVLSEGADIVVATPGRLISHLNMGYVSFDSVKYLILDEADRMLDIGFYDDIMKIISHLPKTRQTLMFSATMAPKIRTLAGKILNNPSQVSTAISKPPEGVLQAVYLAHNEQKIPLINSLIADKPDYESILIFSSTKKKVSEIVHSLRKVSGKVEGISSYLEQNQREEVLSNFRSRQTRVLVATDVLSRGIDIKDINLIINYDVPSDAEDYVHRVGRTARADTTGVALTLVNSEDMYKLHRIEELIGDPIIKLNVPEKLGQGPEWDPQLRRKKTNFRSFKKNNKRYKPNRKGEGRGDSRGNINKPSGHQD
jgi:ATP-dependent RNA helicase RhlE